jgi:hypothetical protein
VKARKRRKQVRAGLKRQMITTPGGRYIDEVGEAYKMGQQRATRAWIGMNPFDPEHGKLERGMAMVALDLVTDAKLEAALKLLGFRTPDFDLGESAVNEGYRRGFVNQLKDYLSYEGRKT